MILSEKMSLQEFARFVLETPVPKGHLDLTSLLFAPFEVGFVYCFFCNQNTILDVPENNQLLFTTNFTCSSNLLLTCMKLRMILMRLNSWI